jgi:D-glycero-D-manno-heptose 1,7-bisphosphate phosphatase
MGIGAVSAGRRAVFLDRDGVLNDAVVRDGKPYSPAGLHELAVPPDVPDALRALRAAGFVLIVVTNQPDVARGIQERSVVEAINTELRARLPLDDVFVCYHDDRDGCSCRKPLPGLLLQAAAEHRIALAQSFMVGDRWRDVEAGRRAGCFTVRLERHYRDPGPESPPSYIAGSLLDAAQWILRHPASTRGGP